MGGIFPFYYSWSFWDPKASDTGFCASCHFVTLLPPSFASRLFCLSCFFFLYPLAPGWGFSTEGAREALQSMTVAATAVNGAVPTAWVTKATFLSLASQNIVSSISQTLTSGKFPGSPRRLTCSWFCTAQQLLCRCEHSCGPFHMACCCCSLARGPAPHCAHFNNWAVVASCICYYLEFYSLLANLISPIPCCS